MLLPSVFSDKVAHTWPAIQTFTASPTSATFTGVPTGLTPTTSTLVVNPASATGSAALGWFGVNGTVKVEINEGGRILAVGAVIATGGTATISSVGNWGRLYTTRSEGWKLIGFTPGSDRVSMGAGFEAQRTLAAHLDQDDLLVKRDVHSAAGAENEAGSVLHLWRDVTGVGAEAGNFLECSTDGATPLFNIEKGGGIHSDGDFDHDGTSFGVCGTAPQAQQAHIVDAANAVGDPPTQAEYNAFVAKFNTLLADLEGFGFLANA